MIVFNDCEVLILQTKIALEEQIAEQEDELARVRKGVKRKDEDRRSLEDALQESKNVINKSVKTASYNEVDKDTHLV